MSESKAAQNYEAFESLRKRFGGAKRAPESHAHQWNSSKQRPKRRHDPRANAPPLMPLVEESDQLQDDLFRDSSEIAKRLHSGRPTIGPTSPVKGKWKRSGVYRSNHLNAPDFDALETDSVASCESSAYSSKSDSLSPTIGSVTELSAYSSKSDSLSPTIGSVTELSDAGSYESFLEYDISRKPRARRLSAPPHLSRAAVLKAFERAGPRTADARLVEQFDIIVHQRTKAWNKALGEWNFDGIPHAHSPTQERYILRPSNEVRLPTPLSTPVYGSMENLECSGSSFSLLSSTYDDSEDDVQWNPEGKYKLGTFVRERRRSSIADTSYKVDSIPKDKEFPQPQESKSEQPISPTTETPGIGFGPKDTHKRTTKWTEAYKTYLDTTKTSEQSTTKNGDSSTDQEVRRKSAEEPVHSSVVEQRAKLFGGTARRGLRRTHSFQIGSRSSPRMGGRLPRFSTPSRPSTSFT